MTPGWGFREDCKAIQVTILHASKLGGGWKKYTITPQGAISRCGSKQRKQYNYVHIPWIDNT